MANLEIHEEVVVRRFYKMENEEAAIKKVAELKSLNNTDEEIIEYLLDNDFVDTVEFDPDCEIGNVLSSKVYLTQS